MALSGIWSLTQSGCTERDIEYIARASNGWKSYIPVSSATIATALYVTHRPHDKGNKEPL